MTLHINLYSWMIPFLITVVSFIIALTKGKPTGSYGDGLDTIFYLLGAFAVSGVSWFLYSMFLLLYS